MKKMLSVLLTAAMLLAVLGMFSASAASDKVLEFNFTPGGDSPIRYVIFSTANITVPEGATFEYDIYLKDNVAGLGTVNVTPTEEHNDMRDAGETGVGLKDQNNIGSHPTTDITEKAFEKWYHRVFQMDGYLREGSINGFLIASEATEAGVCYFDDIVLKDKDGNVIHTFFDDNTNFADYNDGKDDEIGTATYTLNVIDNPVASEQPIDTDPTETDPEPIAPPQTADFTAAIIVAAVVALGAVAVISKKH